MQVREDVISHCEILGLLWQYERDGNPSRWVAPG
jgi:hypothetical protein